MESLKLAFSVGVRKYLLCEQCPLLYFNQLCASVANTDFSDSAPEQTAGTNANSQRARAEEHAQVWRNIDTALSRLPRDQRDALVHSAGVSSLYLSILVKHHLIIIHHYQCEDD